ncbi:hypothetical protein BV22DRAFT_1075898 [Leucogyrophana mollusca]|uniref:Uncharacterized protein n=1 Tax=Leucogyrophana mollusca TaxID=85980 RepID=A0ACB8B094_9AGAM|nr:hypothetical protein BV22DRAFT_1075898 [Leucogyrophana mollusca]
MCPTEELSTIFADHPADAHVHVIIGTLPPGNLVVQREIFLDANAPKSPSIYARAEEFYSQQNDVSQNILCGCPRPTDAPIPVTLLHPVFGQFIDDCESHTVTMEDSAFLLRLSTAMSAFNSDVETRAQTIRDEFADWGLHFIRSNIEGTSYEIQGDMSVDGHRYAIAEFANEIGFEGADPYVQASLRYLESTRMHALEFPGSALPCFIILVFGPYIAFAGAAWNMRPSIQILSAGLPLHYHYTDSKMEITAARHMCAMKKAVHSLQEYYQAYPPPASSLSHSQLFPYRTYFTSRADGSRQDFEYTWQPSLERLLFFGTLRDKNDICVKFVRSYSDTAHALCASMGRAPALRGFERLPGGWLMVVMDALRADDYLDFRGSEPSSVLLAGIKETLTRLHDAGYVHGDVRNKNIMVSKHDNMRFMLVDFDLAGKIGEVRYPMHLNRELWWPEGAVDYALISADHDIAMLRHIAYQYGVRWPPV